MKIAILGGAGQVGSHLARHFCEVPGWSAVALCRSSLVSAGLIAQGLEFRVFDSHKRESIEAALNGCDVVVDTTFAPLANLRRTESLTSLYETILQTPGLKQLIHFSSVAVYGELTASSRPVVKPNPDTIYGRQKLVVERLVARLGQRHSIPTLITRLGHVYGAEMPWSRNWAEHIQNGQLPHAFWEKRSNAVHIHQLCRAVEIAISAKTAGCRNLIGTPNLSWRELFQWHEDAIGTLAKPAPAISNFAPPERYRAGTVAASQDLWRAVRGGAIAGVTSSPRVAHLIRQLLATAPMGTSVADVKAKVGSPALETYFGKNTGDESGYLFDSIALDGPNLPGGGTVEESDRQALRSWFDAIFQPDAAQRYITKSLAAA